MWLNHIDSIIWAGRYAGYRFLVNKIKQNIYIWSHHILPAHGKDIDRSPDVMLLTMGCSFVDCVCVQCAKQNIYFQMGIYFRHATLVNWIQIIVLPLAITNIGQVHSLYIALVQSAVWMNICWIAAWLKCFPEKLSWWLVEHVCQQNTFTSFSHWILHYYKNC